MCVYEELFCYLKKEQCKFTGYELFVIKWYVLFFKNQVLKIFKYKYSMI